MYACRAGVRVCMRLCACVRVLLYMCVPLLLITSAGEGAVIAMAAPLVSYPGAVPSYLTYFICSVHENDNISPYICEECIPG